MDSVEGRFSEWKAEWVKGEGESWKKRVEKIEKVFRSWMVRG